MSFLNLGVRGLKAGITLGYSQNKQGDGLKSISKGTWDCVGGQDLRGTSKNTVFTTLNSCIPGCTSNHSIVVVGHFCCVFVSLNDPKCLCGAEPTSHSF